MRFFLRVSMSILLMPFLLIAMSLVNSNAQAFDEEKCQMVQVKTCVDFGKRMVQGLETNNECWKTQEKFRCVSKEKNHCLPLESNRGCDEKSAQCVEMGNLELCNDLEKTFSCGKILEQNNDLDQAKDIAEKDIEKKTKHTETKEKIKHIETEFHVKHDEKDLSSCSVQEINKYCEEVDEKCIEPGETRNINGKDVYKNCWKWDRQYICRTDTFIDECKQLPDNCKIIGEPDCLHFNSIDNTCDHKEITYQCDETKVIKKECKAKEFCLGEICDKATRTQHNDFAESISSLSILAQMKSNELEGCRCPNGKATCESSEIDPSSCKFFTGGAKQCVKATPLLNCCSNKGELRDFIGCSQDEKDLFQQRKAKLCHHTGSWRGKKINKFKKYHSHCCFKSKLAKIIQVQGRKQLGINWGDRKNPDCRSLTLEEIQRIDFSKIDFSDLYADIIDKVSSGMDKAKNKINQKMGSYQDKASGATINNKATSEMISKKIKQFYEQKK